MPDTKSSESQRNRNLKRNFYKEGRTHKKSRKGKKGKKHKCQRKWNGITTVDEKGKGKAEMMKQGRNKSLLLSLLILNCVHEI
jgi:hypothetical protein